ncbi:hypothetical protein TUM19329_02550 [Legionella antarctica]|uniref:Coiled-coil protein n=1 Tax=Legionella antarctica TaxID=2708020 RepID=A0A6F8SZN7_9GAMM|nr:hypothetical protein [Legionella antarctica]BCA93894.1 hypothetical protein TUM19329_02550 [Legionella antarctica]
MTAVIKHLRINFVQLPYPAAEHSLNWTFGTSIKKLGPDFYSKIVTNHLMLNLEYSILCTQLRHSFSFPEQISRDQVIEQLTAALMLAELLEHVYLRYLIVPREAARLRRHQEVYRSLLTDMGEYSFTPQPIACINVGLSLSQKVREETALLNWVRLLLTRMKRVLNLLDKVGTGSETYRRFVGLLDKYTNPFFAYMTWCFFLPRFLTNLIVISKHTPAWPWMEDEEKELDWWTRLVAQLKRRWFDLGNDSVWITIGLLNCFVFVGVWAPVAVYASLFAFAFDVVNCSVRAYIELNRIVKLQDEYRQLLQQEQNPENIKAIKDYQHFITLRLEYEKMRLGLAVANQMAVFTVMCFAIPLLVTNPVIPLIGALLLIAIWVVCYSLTQFVETYRPNDTVEKPSNIATLGFFAAKPKEASALPTQQKSTPEEDYSELKEYSFCF